MAAFEIRIRKPVNKWDLNKRGHNLQKFAFHPVVIRAKYRQTFTVKANLTKRAKIPKIEPQTYEQHDNCLGCEQGAKIQIFEN